MSASLTGKLARIIELNPERVEPILCDVVRHRWGNVQGTLWERERERSERVCGVTQYATEDAARSARGHNHLEHDGCIRGSGTIRAGEWTPKDW